MNGYVQVAAAATSATTYTSNAAGTTYQVIDTIDGKGGVNTLAITVAGNTDITGAGANFNYSIFPPAAVSNVQKFSVRDISTESGAARVVTHTYDMALFSGETEATNNASSHAVIFSNLGTDTVVGAKGAAASTTFGYATQSDAVAINLQGATATTIANSGPGATTAVINSAAGTASTVTTLTLASGSTVTGLTINAASDVSIGTLNGVASTAALTVTGAGAVSTGFAGKTINAALNSGGLDVTTSGAVTSLVGGTGDDTVTLGAALAATGTVALGAGNDSIDASTSPATMIASTNTVDGGLGFDTVQAALIGSLNAASFSNFEELDAIGLTGTFNMATVTAANNIQNITTTGALGAAATISNIGAGINFDAQEDMGAAAAGTTLTLAQATAGSLSVMLDNDTDVGAAGVARLNAVASNATSLNAIFDSNSAAASTALQTITLTGSKATSLSVVSAGTNLSDGSGNVLQYVYGKQTATANADGLLTSVSISGSTDLNASFSDGTNFSESNIAAVNASALTGDLAINLGSLKAQSASDAVDGGLLTLGSGVDSVTIRTALNATNANGREVSGLTAGTSTSYTTADKLVIADNAGVQGNGSITGGTVTNGLITFTGAGPASLADAIAIAAAAVSTDVSVAFSFNGSTYIYSEYDNAGAAVGQTIELVGQSIHGLATAGGNTTLYVY